MNLWIDDAKPAPDETWAIAKTYDDAVRLLSRYKYDIVAIDHDLGGERTGYDILCLMECGRIRWPIQIRVISWNPVGVLRMKALLEKNNLKEIRPLVYVLPEQECGCPVADYFELLEENESYTIIHRPGCKNI